MPVLITNIIVNLGVASPRSQQKPKQSQKYATSLRKVRNPRENILLKGNFRGTKLIQVTPQGMQSSAIQP